MSSLSSLRSRLRSRIHTTEVLLATMMAPVQTRAQELKHAENIKRINDLTHEANTDFRDIKAKHRDDIDATEFEDFRISLTIIQNEKNLRQKKATETAKSIHTHIKMDYNALEQEITKHGNYLTAEDHEITKGMEKREPWREQMEQITKSLSDLIATVINNSISRTDVDIRALGDKIYTLQDLLPTIIASIEEADREQGLFSDQPTNPHPLKIPSYSGTFGEDFTAFKDNFKEAAKDSKISKTNQL